MIECDLLIVGAGPAGLAAAKASREISNKEVYVLERDVIAGGILNQCIHDGFGLIRYRETLTGPEYAARAADEAINGGAHVLTSRHVFDLKHNGKFDNVVSAYTANGIEQYRAKTVIFSTGCRERTRGNISIPGSRPAGIFTAGVAQNLINIRNIMIGKKVVILGSGDIGLIMARRLSLEGAEVKAIAEIMKEPMGLARNVSQCVLDFGIPLYVSTTVSRIIGKKRLEAVELSKVDETGQPIPGTDRIIECDALILSVGLIPENEVVHNAGVNLANNNSAKTDCFLQTNLEGVFSCGNSRRVMDLADYVSEQGEIAGRNAVHLIDSEAMEKWNEEKTNCMKKGFPEKDSVTCPICPNGCQIKWNDKTQEFSGNKCSRGEEFARQEKKAPTRTVTTTVRVNNIAGGLRPVKTNKPIRKEEVRDLVNKLKEISISDITESGEIVFTYSGVEKVDIVTTS